MKTRTVLYAEDGMVLTDGQIYGKHIFLPEGTDPALFYEIPENQIPQGDTGGEAQ